MIKSIAFMTRRPGITREEFARHYEEIHVPLALSVIPIMRGYVRNHVIRGIGHDADFDCMSTFWYDSADAVAEVIKFWQADEGTVLREDEATFMEQRRTVSFSVDERVTQLPNPRERGALVKAIAFLKRKPGLTPQEFVDRYERAHAPMVVKYYAGLAGYVRNYVGGSPTGARPDFDAVTELWYENLRAFDASLLTTTEGGQALKRDGEQFMQPDIRVLLVNERLTREPR